MIRAPQGRVLVGLASAALLVAPVAGCATAPELEFEDWVLPVPEGTPVFEYAPVARADRNPEAIRLVEELVIGGEPESRFYSRPQIAVTDDGTIFVLDAADHSVRAFDLDGKLLREFGREGQGPGEMQQGRGITIAGDYVLVADGLTRTRILVFTLQGEAVGSYQTGRSFGLQFHGLPDGTFVESNGIRVDDGSRHRVGGRYTSEGEEVHRYFDVYGAPPREIPTSRDRSVRMRSTVQYSIDSWVVQQIRVFTNGERIFATLQEQYEVLAMDLDGAPLWAARVAWPRPPYPEWMKESNRRSAERYEFDPDVLTYPAQDNAVSTTNVDGHGRVHVYPNPGPQPEDDPYRPVDVFSPDGRLIAAGVGPASWITANGDQVFSVRHDEDTDDWFIIRARLEIDER